MSSKIGTVTREEARELKRRSAELDRRGGGVPHEAVEARWLAKMGRELRQMVRDYDGGTKGAKKILEAFLIAEEECLPDLADIRQELLAKMAKKMARKRAA